jgi:metal-responsive CopG/Arc/MetJ family transcriptional regulator
MTAAKIAITLDNNLLRKLDYFVHHKIFKNRSQAIQASVYQTIERMEHKRLARECIKLNVAFERSMAEEDLATDLEEWPEY